jgi:uncharacterized protein YndB with AHSA1/START domain
MEHADQHESIIREVELDLSPDEMWDAITDRHQLEQWLGETVDIDVRAGGTGVVVDDDVRRDVVVERVDRGRAWSFRWRRQDTGTLSRVTFEVIPARHGGSRLAITETLVASARAAHQLRWEARLACLWVHTMAFARAR